MKNLAAVELDPYYNTVGPVVQPLPRRIVKLHSPPRMSAKMTQTIRHAAAKAVRDLGLAGAAAARVSGWVALSPSWQDLYSKPAAYIPTLPDHVDAGAGNTQKGLHDI